MNLCSQHRADAYACRGIVHGGLTAMIIDEALGALIYLLKREAVLGPGPAFTAHLEVDYKKVCTSSAARCRPWQLLRQRFCLVHVRLLAL